MKPLRIVIFAKAPCVGFAKTRLIPALGEAGAAELAKQMLLHTLHEALAADIGPVELCITPEINDPSWHGIQLPRGLEISDQGEGDLGERMARAARRGIEQGVSVILIGTDCPALDATCLRQIAQGLNETDAVIVPVTDGGYSALGLNRFHPLLFSDIAWSTDSVALDTLCRFGQLGWPVRQQPMLHDIDEPIDLQWLPVGWIEMLYV